MIGGQMQTPAQRALAALGLAALVALVVAARLAWSTDRRHLGDRQRGWRLLSLVTVGLVAVVAVDLLPDLAEETEWAHRADELLVQVLAGAAVAWFASARRRRVRSLAPLAIAAAVEAVKLAGIGVEWGDTPDVQGDQVLAAIGAPALATLALLHLRLWRGPRATAPAAVE